MDPRAAEYTLKAIFSAQTGPAYDWLLPRGKALLDLLSRDPWPGEIVQHLVGCEP